MPTLAGWFLIVFFCLSLFAVAIRNLHPFLAVDAPSGARFLVVEGWMYPGELDQALVRFRNGKYTKIITTGGPPPAMLRERKSTTYAELARNYFIQSGLPESVVIAIPTPESAQDRTYLSAVMVRSWFAKSGILINSLDVFSSGIHSRRSRSLYSLAFGPDVHIGILAALPVAYDPSAWWKTSIGAKTVITETISWIWTEILFVPPPQGSREEKWGP